MQNVNWASRKLFQLWTRVLMCSINVIVVFIYSTNTKLPSRVRINSSPLESICHSIFPNIRGRWSILKSIPHGRKWVIVYSLCISVVQRCSWSTKIYPNFRFICSMNTMKHSDDTCLYVNIGHGSCQNSRHKIERGSSVNKSILRPSYLHNWIQILKRRPLYFWIKTHKYMTRRDQKNIQN